MPRISTETLVYIAGFGGLFVAGTGYYFRNMIREKVKETPCYEEGIKLLREHKGAQSVLGTPIRDFKFDLDDKSKNNWTEDKATFSVPVRGSQAAGQYQFWTIKKPEGWIVTKADLNIESIEDRILAIKREEKNE